MGAIVKITRGEGERALQRKPAHGSPCNRCGLCCMISICELGRHLFKREAMPGPCPALVRDDTGLYACSVARDPQRYIDKPMTAVEAGAMQEAARQIIYADDGCDCRVNGEPVNREYRERCTVTERKNFAERQAALRLWGIEK